MIRFLFRLVVRGVITVVMVGGILVAVYLYRSGRLPFLERAVHEAKIAGSVQAALAIHRDLGDRHVEVTVDEDVVTLRGSVRSEEERRAAEELAASVEGVASVENRIDVEPAVPDPEIGPDERRSLGERLDDTALRAKVEAALHLDRRTRNAPVRVTVARGRVVLEGRVESSEIANLVRARVNAVEGVDEIEDRLVVDRDADERSGSGSGSSP
jgi:osmotically-inducible protein OsmY